MRAHPGPAYDPSSFKRGYSRELIVEHLDECLSIFAELDETHSIDAAIAPTVFATIQTMVSAVEPTPEALERVQRAAKIATPSRLGIVGNGQG